MTATEKRIYDFLGDYENFNQYHIRDPKFLSLPNTEHVARIVRNRFITTNGFKLSIQQSDAHYTRSFDTVEVWNFPEYDEDKLESLSIFKNAEDPLGHVQISVLAEYVDWLESTDKVITNFTN